MPYIDDDLMNEDKLKIEENKNVSKDRFDLIRNDRKSIVGIRDNVVHFMSADLEPVGTVSKLLIAVGEIDLPEMKSRKPKVGKILITPRGKFNVYTVITKERH